MTVEMVAECTACAWPETPLKVSADRERIRDLIETASEHSRDYGHRVHFDVIGDPAQREAFLVELRAASDL